MSSYSINALCIRHQDPSYIDRVVSAFNKNALFSEFIPIPQEIMRREDELISVPLTHPGSGHFYHFEPLPQEWIKEYVGREVSRPLGYVWCLEHWGTKWDVGADGEYGNSLRRKSATEVQLLFLTANTPPIPVLNHWVDLGYEVYGSLESDSDWFSLVYVDRRLARVPFKERYEEIEIEEESGSVTIH